MLLLLLLLFKRYAPVLGWPDPNLALTKLGRPAPTPNKSEFNANSSDSPNPSPNPEPIPNHTPPA